LCRASSAWYSVVSTQATKSSRSGTCPAAHANWHDSPSGTVVRRRPGTRSEHHVFGRARTATCLLDLSFRPSAGCGAAQGDRRPLRSSEPGAGACRRAIPHASASRWVRAPRQKPRHVWRAGRARPEACRRWWHELAEGASRPPSGSSRMYVLLGCVRRRAAAVPIAIGALAVPDPARLASKRCGGRPRTPPHDSPGRAPWWSSW